MKSLFGFILLFSVLAHANVPAVVSAVPQKPIAGPVKLSQDEASKKLIHELMYGDTESTSRYFVDSVKPNLTKDTFIKIQSQITWLSKLIGDSLELFMSGTQTSAKDHESIFFREYRLANESNKRSPLIVIHLWFLDSLATKADGAFVKTFLEDSQKRLDGEQTWKVEGRDVDISEIALIEFKMGNLLAIKVYDTDTTTMDTTLAKAKGIPIIKEAIARGFLAKAKSESQNKVLLKDVGVAFIIKDPHFGYTQFKYGIAKKYFNPEADSAKTPKPKAAKKSAKIK